MLQPGKMSLKDFVNVEKEGYADVDRMTDSIKAKEDRNQAEIDVMEKTEFFGGKHAKASSLIQTDPDGSWNTNTPWNTQEQNDDLKAIGSKFEKELGDIKSNFDSGNDDGNQGAAGAISLLQTSDPASKDAKTEAKPDANPENDNDMREVTDEMAKLNSMKLAAVQRAKDVQKWADDQSNKFGKDGKLNTKFAKAAEAEYEKSHQETLDFEKKFSDGIAAGIPASLLQTGAAVESKATSGGVANDLPDIDPHLFHDPTLEALLTKISTEKDSISDDMDKVKDDEDKAKGDAKDAASSELEEQHQLEIKLTNLPGLHTAPVGSLLEEGDSSEAAQAQAWSDKRVEAVTKFTKTPMWNAVGMMAAQSTSSLLEQGMPSEAIAGMRGLVHGMSKKPQMKELDDKMAATEARIAQMDSKVKSELDALDKSFEDEKAAHVSSLIQEGHVHPEHAVIDMMDGPLDFHYSKDLLARKADLEKTKAITHELHLKAVEARAKLHASFKKQLGSLGVPTDLDDTDSHDSDNDDDDDDSSLLEENMRKGPKA